jgi:hypothetical protein
MVTLVRRVVDTSNDCATESRADSRNELTPPPTAIAVGSIDNAMATLS